MIFDIENLFESQILALFDERQPLDSQSTMVFYAFWTQPACVAKSKCSLSQVFSLIIS